MKIEELEALAEKSHKDGLNAAAILLNDYLFNQRHEIIALVKAAKSAHQTLVDEGFHAKALRLGQALAAFEDKK